MNDARFTPEAGGLCDPWRRRCWRSALAVSAALLTSACTHFRQSGLDDFSTPASYAGVRNDLALFALSLLDTPYAWGGRGPATGFDCSGLVAHVYREAGGIRLVGSSADLGKKSRPIEPKALLPGDLVFFNTLGARHSHVGLYVGNGKFVHASNPRTGVRIDHLGNKYYAQRFEGAHTLLD